MHLRLDDAEQAHSASVQRGRFTAETLFCLQDVSTMIRYKLNPIIFLVNNGGYTIEVEIHDGPYNYIQNWDYSGLVQCFDNHQGNVFSTKVSKGSRLCREETTDLIFAAPGQWFWAVVWY